MANTAYTDPFVPPCLTLPEDSLHVKGHGEVSGAEVQGAVNISEKCQPFRKEDRLIFISAGVLYGCLASFHLSRRADLILVNNQAT